MKKYRNDILAGLASAGLVLTAYEAAIAREKLVCKKLIKKFKKESDEDLTVVDKTEQLGLLYLPTFVTGALTLKCIFKLRDAAVDVDALSRAYGITAGALLAYRKDISNLIGIDKEAEIGTGSIEFEGNFRIPAKETLYYEPFCKVAFTVTPADLIKAVCEVNRIFTTTGHAYVSDFYKALRQPIPKLAYEFGWDISIAEEFGCNWIDVIQVKRSAKSKSGKNVDYYVLSYSIEPLFG